jgi:predicted DNA-binding protein with PD1-like motif
MSAVSTFAELVVVFIPLQVTLGGIVEPHRDHVHLLYDLPNSKTLAQKIVASLVLPITEILIIEYHKLDSTFLHVTFGSQSLFESTSDQIGSDTN